VHHLPGYRGNDWDAYALFGPDAEWTAAPPPVLSSGSNVIDRTDALQAAIGPLLATPAHP